MKHTLFLVFLTILLFGCNHEEFSPKPKAFLRLEYPPHSYERIQNRLPFSFEKSKYARFTIKSDTTFDLQYPGMKANIYMTYSPVQNNLKQLLKDAEKLSYKHTVKADGFTHRDFINESKHVYGRLTLITGNAASPLQFYLTDSSKHFVTGSLYFYAVPNYDSIRPPLEYLKEDVRRLMETWQWKN